MNNIPSEDIELKVGEKLFLSGRRKVQSITFGDVSIKGGSKYEQRLHRLLVGVPWIQN